MDHEIIEIFIENPKYLTATIKSFDTSWFENVSEVKRNVYAVTRVFLFASAGLKNASTEKLTTVGSLEIGH